MGRSRPRLPDAVARHVPDGDRALAHAPLRDGGWAIATRAALLLVFGDGEAVRHGWDDVEHGSWDGDAETLTIRWVDGSAATTLAPVAPVGRAFPEAFRERVQWSVVHVERATLRPGVTAQVVIRRDASGALGSRTTVDGGGALSERERLMVARVEHSARHSVGLAP
jgi:hypothetical protein